MEGEAEFDLSFIFFQEETMKESDFQAALILELKELFPGSLVIKADAGYIQGIPDLLILYKDRWAALECKVEHKASRQPNQSYYVRRMNEMSFCKFIYPENKTEVLYELQQALGF